MSSNHIKFGKNGELGSIDLSKLRAGLKKSDVVKNNSALGSIFDKYDTNPKDETLDSKEIENLKNDIMKLAGDDNELSAKEAKRFVGQDGKKVGKKGKNALYQLLNNLAETTEGIKSVQREVREGKEIQIITYDDGHTEELYPDGSKIVEIMSGNKKTKTLKDDKDNTYEEVVTENEGEDDEIVTTTSMVDGQKQTVIQNKADKTTTTITYNGDKKAEEIIVGENSTTIITYDSEGKPASEVETSGTTEKTYIYQDGQKVLQSTVENKGLAGKEATKTYDSEGKETQVEELPNGKITTVKDSDGNVISKVKTEIINGQEVSLALDKDGNIPGVIVQNGESPATIAKKFGCSVDELKELNKDLLKGSGKNKYFVVGAEIKLPNSVSIERFAKASQGRKSAEMAKQDYANVMAEKATKEKEHQDFLKSVHLKSEEGKGEKIKDKSGKEWTILGVTDTYGEFLLTDGKGNNCLARHSDRQIIDSGYVEARNMRDNGQLKESNVNISGANGKKFRYAVDSNGKAWYFTQNGNFVPEETRKQIIQKEATTTSNMLIKAAKNGDAWYNVFGTGIDTDDKAMEAGISRIYSREILDQVNANLKKAGFQGDNKTTPVEALILDENNHKSARPLLTTLINSGAMTKEEQATTIKREMDYEIEGQEFGPESIGRMFTHFEFGTTWTSSSDLDNYMQMATNSGVREAIEKQYEAEGTSVSKKLEDDGWDDRGRDQFDANWIQSGAYQEERIIYKKDDYGRIIYDAQGQPVIDRIDKGDQDHRDEVADRLIFGYNNKVALNKGLSAINDDDASADQRHFLAKAAEQVKTDSDGKYQERFKGQDIRQRYIAGFHLDSNGKVDAGEVSASNTCLYKGLKPARICAEETLYDVKEGKYAHSFDSFDSDTYAAMAELIAAGNVEGIENMEVLYDRAYESVTKSEDKQKIMANGIISGQLKGKFTDEQITDFCVELMHSIDANKGKGGSTGRTAEYTNTADYQEEQLKAILQNNPQIMDAVKERVSKDNFSYTTILKTNNSLNKEELDPFDETRITTDTKDKYMQLLADTKNIVNEEVFLDADGKQITDENQIAAIKYANMQSLEQMRQYVAELERDFKKGVDAEGVHSDIGNAVLEYSGFGTDRDDVATEYRNAKLMLQQFEAAAQGRLRDSNGKVISAQELAQQMLDKQNALAEANSDYKQSVAYARMGVVLAPVVLLSGGAGLAAEALGLGAVATGVTTGLVAGGTTYGMNALEYKTSYTGDTDAAHEQNLQDSLINGITGGIGVAQMKPIMGMANNMGTVARTGIRIATTVASDTAVSVAATGLTTGDYSYTDFYSNLLISGFANGIGYKAFTAKTTKTTPHVSVSTDTPEVHIQTENLTTAASHKASAGAPVETAPPGTVTVGREKAKAITAEVDNVVGVAQQAIESGNDAGLGAELAQKHHELNSLGSNNRVGSNRQLRRSNQAKLDEVASQLSPAEQQAYNAAKRANCEADVNHVFEKTGPLDNNDVRTINDYIKMADDPAELDALLTRLNDKEMNAGGVTNDFRNLETRINARKAELQPKPISTLTSSLHSKDDVASLLAKDGNLTKEDIDAIITYIKTVDDNKQLNELGNLINGRKMYSNQSRALKNAIKEQQAAIKNGTVVKEEPIPEAEKVNGDEDVSLLADEEDVPFVEPGDGSQNNLGGDNPQGPIVIGGSDSPYLRSPSERTFNTAEIDDFKAQIYANEMDLHSSLSQQGFEFEHSVPSDEGTLYSFIDNQNQTRKVFVLSADGEIKPLRMMSTDGNNNYSTVELFSDGTHVATDTPIGQTKRAEIEAEKASQNSVSEADYVLEELPDVDAPLTPINEGSSAPVSTPIDNLQGKKVTRAQIEQTLEENGYLRGKTIVGNDYESTFTHKATGKEVTVKVDKDGNVSWETSKSAPSESAPLNSAPEEGYVLEELPDADAPITPLNEDSSAPVSTPIDDLQGKKVTKAQIEKTLEDNGYVNSGAIIGGGEYEATYINKATGEEVKVKVDKDGNVSWETSKSASTEPAPVNSAAEPQPSNSAPANSKKGSSLWNRLFGRKQEAPKPNDVITNNGGYVIGDGPNGSQTLYITNGELKDGPIIVGGGQNGSISFGGADLYAQPLHNVRPATGGMSESVDRLVQEGKNQLDANYKLYLGAEGYPQFELDLASLNLKEGQTIEIGRSADPNKGGIKVPEEFDTVSNQHLKITRRGNDFVVEDLSSNGTSVVHSRVSADAAPTNTASNTASSAVAHEPDLSGYTPKQKDAYQKAKGFIDKAYGYPEPTMPNYDLAIQDLKSAEDYVKKLPYGPARTELTERMKRSTLMNDFRDRQKALREGQV